MRVAGSGLPEDALVLVHTGFAPFDDRLLADVFLDIARREPRVRLVTTGRRVSSLDAAAAAAGAADRLFQLGVVPYAELGGVMACGDAMLVPYTRRPHNTARFPNRVGDYLAAGRPIVTNPTGDLGHLVAEEESASSHPRIPAGSPTPCSSCSPRLSGVGRWAPGAGAGADNVLVARPCGGARGDLRRARSRPGRAARPSRSR